MNQASKCLDRYIRSLRPIERKEFAKGYLAFLQNYGRIPCPPSGRLTWNQTHRIKQRIHSFFDVL